MDWLNRMNGAMDYIEAHLGDTIEYQDLAKIACCSTYHFQRMFAFITEIPLSEYIRRRRLTQAAFDLQNSRERVIDIALKYGYESPEAFSRAFKALHGVMPVLARDKGSTMKAYPRLTFHISIRGDVEMNYRIVEREAFNLCGITTEISVAGGQNYVTIPRFWEDNMENGAIDGLKRALGLKADGHLKAALYNFREGVFSYMICSEGPQSGTPEGYAALSVPSLTWAVFTTPEHDEEKTTEEIQSIWKRIFPEWFPASGYEHADGPELEVYYSSDSGKSVAEVWIPVMKK